MLALPHEARLPLRVPAEIGSSQAKHFLPASPNRMRLCGRGSARIAERQFDDVPANSANPETRPHDLVSGGSTGTLFWFALPIFFTSILQSLNGSINAIWVGQLLGENALAATINSTFIMALFLSFIVGLGTAISVFVGQAIGRGEKDRARRVFVTSTTALFLATVAIVVPGWLFAPALLDILAIPASAFDLAVTYLRVIVFALPGMVVAVVMMMALRGSGDSRTPLWFMITALILDNGLSPVFILGLGPAPQLGIAGAATATIIANVVSLAALIAFMASRDIPLRLTRAQIAYLRPDFTLLRDVVRKGVPIGLRTIASSASAILLIGFVNREGAVTTVAFGIMVQIWTYVQIPATSLGIAATAMAAHSIGARNWKRVDELARLAVIFTLISTAVLVVLLGVFHDAVFSIFLPSDSEANDVAQHIHTIASWSYLLFGATIVLFSVLHANGAVMGPLAILLFAFFPVRFGFLFLAYPYLGADALWWSFPASFLAALILAIALYLHGGWKKQQLERSVDRNKAVDNIASPLAEENRTEGPLG